MVISKWKYTICRQKNFRKRLCSVPSGTEYAGGISNPVPSGTEYAGGISNPVPSGTEYAGGLSNSVPSGTECR
ncbi:MAG: hypothetical protein LBJ47_08170 [Tannerella sp.]|nr:hypothetical protein [Tannerella sp.]